MPDPVFKYSGDVLIHLMLPLAHHCSIDALSQLTQDWVSLAAEVFNVLESRSRSRELSKKQRIRRVAAPLSGPKMNQNASGQIAPVVLSALC